MGGTVLRCTLRCGWGTAAEARFGVGFGGAVGFENAFVCGFVTLVCSGGSIFFGGEDRCAAGVDFGTAIGVALAVGAGLASSESGGIAADCIAIGSSVCIGVGAVPSVLPNSGAKSTFAGTSRSLATTTRFPIN